MKFEFDADEVALQDTVRSFCRGRFPTDVVRAGEETGSVVDRERWRELADLGVFGVAGPDGLGLRAGVVVFEELGRALLPGPLVDCALGAAFDGAVADGSSLAVVVEATEPVRMIEHPLQFDLLLVLDADLVRIVRPSKAFVAGLVAVERPLDSLTPIAPLSLVIADGEVVGDARVAGRAWRDGCLLTAAQQVGLAFGALELAVAYAKQREQFGRPIGSFQAVKHLAAEMLVKAEVARVAVHAAACAADGASPDDPMRAASVAKMLAGEAALFCGKTAIQIHGGMGYTWEVDAQRYWKRACVLDTHFGNGDDHAERVAQTA